MKSGILSKHWIKKAEAELEEHQKSLKQQENKKIFETMLSLAAFGDLTPERYPFFLSIISNQRIGGNDVQKYIYHRSCERQDLEE